MVLKEVLFHCYLFLATIAIPHLESIGLRCKVFRHAVYLIRLRVVGAYDDLSRIVNVRRVVFLKEIFRVISTIDMLVKLFKHCLLGDEFGTRVDVEEDAECTLLRVQFVTWPLSAAVLVRNAFDFLLIVRQEELRKPTNLLVVFLAERVLDDDVEVQEHSSEDIVARLRRHLVCHLVLDLMESDATEVIKLDLAIDAKFDFVLPSMISTMNDELGLGISL